MTNNLKDFPAEVLQEFGIEAQSPDEFVMNVLDLAPEDVYEAAEAHRMSLKNPVKTVAEYLNTLEISRNRRKYTAFGVSIISDRNLQASYYNVVAFGKQGHFAKPLQAGTRIKLVVQAQSQPDNIASIPLLTVTFVQPVRPVAWGQ